MGLIKTAAKAAVASSVHGRVQRRQQQRWAAQDQAAGLEPHQAGPAQPSLASPAAQAPPSLGTADKITQLKSLGELRDGGVLTDAEFESEKRKLLGG